ncbi:LytTR family DNA-binding domain-containing protein [Sphingobacterium siyangense]|uniref:LytR/AlgR family response regulator transcription factor n=1 Tax=Sphingobacterium siyangense TaxID=459529 RepID=UPI00301AA7B2
MINCILIEDEPLAKQGIERHLAEIPFCNLHQSFDNAIQALPYVMANRIDLIISDINMPGLNGIDFLKSLSKKPQFIFITGMADYAADSYDLEVFDFIRKPYTFDRLMKSLLRFREQLSKQQLTGANAKSGFFTLKDNYMNYLIPYEQIQYIEGDREYIKINTVEKQYLTINSLKKIINVLPSELFMRVHKSYIVNVELVKAVGPDKLMMRGSIKDIPLGVTYRDEVFKKWNLH